MAGQFICVSGITYITAYFRPISSQTSTQYLPSFLVSFSNSFFYTCFLSPTTQTFTALETITANLCWILPLVGWLNEKYR
ncbi:hypothetical protein MSLAZ_2002 [Methanosarcina lacustris Z-7289]|uniref:Uncharacterized protein n=1 Tax=Methanosarcina lacustris Z-7289 TaxID=1434111 RepID=A0A0E3S866_9EURY|nr:hypothetical protein MSLAZ_2002 [Methanosarcina lacustris Z-7289]